MENNVVIYQSNDGLVKMEAIVDASNETIWATQKAMAQLFGVNVSGISRHLVNVFSSGELDEKSNLQKMQIAKSDKPVAFYSLDVIISVGYRVNSIRATAFRQWATSVLKQYMIKGYDSVPLVPTEKRHPLPSGWRQKNRRRHPRRTDPDDCRKPDGRDGHPCQGGRESYK